MKPRTKSDEVALSEGCYFDEAAAERVRRFASRCCRHTKGQWAGKPFDFLPWQWEDVVKPIFGWKRADGRRRFSKAYIEIPKKNGKSTLCAVFALYLLCADDEPGAEVYGAALDRNQASIVFREAMLMARRSPVLSAMLRIKEAAKVIHYDAGDALYRCLSADAGRQEGLNIHGLIFDEYHVQKDPKLSEALEFGGAARQQPLIIKITTAGDDKESICYETHRYAKGILERGEVDTSFFAYIRVASPDDDPDDPATWRKANPSYGVTIREDAFRDDWRQAKKSPRAWNSWRRYRLNQWVEETTGWIDEAKWAACGEPPLFGEDFRWFGGLDMSSTTDLTSFVLWHPETGSVIPYYWVPQEAFKERERRNKTKIDHWARQGFIRVIPGAMIKDDTVFRDVEEIGRNHRIEKIGADPYNAVKLLCRLRDDAGFDVEAFRQGMMSMSPPMKDLEARILDGAVRHGGHPVLSWNMRNLAVKTDESENIRPAKNKSADKIDGVVAWIMADGVALQAEDVSVYERSGF